MSEPLRFGFPRMHKEAGERRDFLPAFIGMLHSRGAHVALEHGYGTGLGLCEADYRQVAPSVEFVPYKTIFQQDYILVVRYPEEAAIRWMHPGACLISMVHYPTRQQRVEQLRSLGLEAISLDAVKDDSGRRVVENLQSVAWNGMQVAFETLMKTYPYPGLENPNRLPVQVTVLGAGAVGTHVFQAALNYGNVDLRKRLALANVPGVKVTAIDYDLTGHSTLMLDILARTDILVDATFRPDPSRPIIPNGLVAYLPEHAIILDLAVDPYECTANEMVVKSIEGIPHGNLDQFVFQPDDPVYEHLPDCIDRSHRRHVVSCYSWPGVHPWECMEVYGSQLQPIAGILILKEGIQNINPDGNFFERAISRAQLSRWEGNNHP